MDNTGFIDIFVADKPEGNRPHFKGFIKVNGQKLEFAAWPAKSGKQGVYSGKVKPAQEKQQAQPPSRSWDEDAETVPF